MGNGGLLIIIFPLGVVNPCDPLLIWTIPLGEIYPPGIFVNEDILLCIYLFKI